MAARGLNKQTYMSPLHPLYDAMLCCCWLNVQDDYTALHLAVQYGKHLAAQTLLGYGADVNVTGGAVSDSSILQH